MFASVHGIGEDDEVEFMEDDSELDVIVLKRLDMRPEFFDMFCTSELQEIATLSHFLTKLSRWSTNAHFYEGRRFNIIPF